MTRKEHCYEGEPHSDFSFSSDSVISFLSLSFSGIVIFWLPVLSMENEKNANSAIRRFARSCKAGKRSLRGYSWSYIREAPLETKEEKKRKFQSRFLRRERGVSWKPNGEILTTIVARFWAFVLSTPWTSRTRFSKNENARKTILFQWQFEAFKFERSTTKPITSQETYTRHHLNRSDKTTAIAVDDKNDKLTVKAEMTQRRKTEGY